jgi:hypothetical protein
MTSFNEREQGFERKFAHDEELQFKARARRNKLLGVWAAEQAGLSGDAAAAYAKDIVAVDLERAGDDDVIDKVLGDLISAGLEFKRDEVVAQLNYWYTEAQKQIVAE